MKGVVFNILEEFVEKQLGKSGLEQIRREVGYKPFVAIGNYPDELVHKIVAVGSRLTGLDPEDLVFEFGKFFANSPTLHKVYGQYFKAHKTARDMLVFTDELHERLTRSMPGATPPRFRYEEPDPKKLAILYTSHRHLCTLLRGITQGVADYYNEEVSIRETSCMKKGASECRIEVTFLGARTQPKSLQQTTANS